MDDLGYGFKIFGILPHDDIHPGTRMDDAHQIYEQSQHIQNGNNAHQFFAMDNGKRSNLILVNQEGCVLYVSIWLHYSRIAGHIIHNFHFLRIENRYLGGTFIVLNKGHADIAFRDNAFKLIFLDDR